MIIENQQLAVLSKDKNILLSASAGTGKTYTMVQRIVNLVKNGEDISSFLVLAFANDAAAEMKERVEKQITALALEDAKFAPQVRMLKTASISTISSFALEIAKSYFSFCGASPKAKILTGSEESVTKALAMENVFSRLHEEKNPDFLFLCEYFSRSRKDDRLKEIIFEIYRHSRNMPKGELEKNFYSALDSAVLENMYTGSIKSKCADFADSIKDFPVVEIYAPHHAQACSIIKAILSATTIEEIFLAVDIDFLTKKTMNKSFPESWAFANENFHTNFRAKFKKFITDTAKQLQNFENGFDTPPHYLETAKKLFALSSIFETEYSRLKKENDYLDFSDTEHMLHTCLLNEEIASEIAGRYKYVFCDEYQDVSQIQEEILQNISKQASLFVVGDIKQSIFRFRASDESIIKAREKQIKESNSGLFLPMNTNFRSHGDILNFANAIFSRAMQNPDICDYASSSMFESGKEYAEKAEIKIALFESKKAPARDYSKVYNLEGDKGEMLTSKTAEREAEYIASFVQEKLGKRFDFAGETREIKPSDFAILLRSNDDKYINALLSAFSNREIAIHAKKGEAALKTKPKIIFLVDFLKTISNPYDDIALYSTLKSPFFDFSEEVIFSIRKANPKGMFSDCFFAFATATAKSHGIWEEGCESVFDVDFSRLSESHLSPEELLAKTFMCKFKRYKTLSAVSAGSMLKIATAENNVEEKITIAYSAFEWEYAWQLINFVDSLEDKSLGMAISKFEDTSVVLPFELSQSHAVQITTMHKSKGLEYPFVVLCGLGKKYNKQDIAKEILFHKDYGLAFENRDIEKRKKTPTLQKLGLATLLSKELCEEEARLLYVAITRAKFKLLITATIEGEFSLSEKTYTKATPMHKPAHLYANNCHIGVILSALQATNIEACHQFLVNPKPIAQEESTAKQVSFDAEKTDSHALAILQNGSLQKSFQTVPTKLSASSRVAGLYMTATLEEDGLLNLEKYETQKIDNILEELSQTTENAPLSRAEIGTAYHKIVETIDFFLSKQEIEKEVASIILAGEIPNIEYDIAKIASLTSNPMFGNCKITKEVPFVMKADGKLFGFFGDVLCQGVIDCLLQGENGETIVVDYKATSIKSHQKLREKYKPQLEIYALACQTILKTPKPTCYIYSIFSEELIKIDL